ncbi:liver carboxylesterase 1 precursor (secreted protein) [Ophiostoma piceae UAMH 11346]|uniref:Carboxylic ester hydrolase n=1 Tax=Ophiostoma piceae (strain UAMH 11346) TaxID=1262450 RepID=S3BZJ5_OPHP1|nr:liver carboxylesterase 1 precursor (secreted protein) [Ophiostoma piceae UAMH 11346]
MKPAIVLSCLAAAAASAPSPGHGPTVATASGPIVGITTGLANSSVDVHQFLGIPYASPPLKSLRFAPPTPPANRRGKPLYATSWPNACIQQGSGSLLTSQSEDCLYLNVFSPATPAPPAGRTVMVWIHGGALKTGTSASTEYDGSILATSQDVLVITINYRLNVFGFSNAPALPLVDRNAGFYDQRMALQWVQENIAAFGGDPDKVTVFGESSGSTSVSRLVSTMVVDPPFRAAILESGWYDYASIMDSAADTTGPEAWTTLVGQLNCTSTTNSSDAELACMRGVNSAAFSAVLVDSAVSFKGVNDNVTQRAYPEQARLQGEIAMVPILTGTNADEGSLFMSTSVTSWDEFAAAFPTVKSVQAQLEAVLPVSAAGPYTTQYAADVAVATDTDFTCAVSRIVAFTAALGLPVWRYYFNATFPNTALAGYGVYHSSEIPLVFGTFTQSNATVDEVALSEAMQWAWAKFAKDPWGSGPGWPRAGVSGGSGEQRIAALGSPNRNPSGWAMIDNSTVDERCYIYESVFANAGGGTPWW